MLYRLLNGIFQKREESVRLHKKRGGGGGAPGAGSPQNGDEGGDGSVKPFLDHLEDLRWTAIKMAATLVVAMIVAFIFRAQLFRLFEWPLHEAGLNSKDILRYQSFVEAFTAAISMSFYMGIIVSMPILLYFLGQFVLPALTIREKKAVLPAIIVGFFLFLGGATFCFIEILPRTLQWLNAFAKDSGIPIISDAKAYFGLVAQLCIAFGLLCELPVVMVTLNAIGLVSYKWLSGTRVYAIAGVFVLSAVVAPTSDLITLFMLAGPIAVLYEICIWIVWYLDKRRAAQEAADEARLNRPYDDKPPDEPID